MTDTSDTTEQAADAERIIPLDGDTMSRGERATSTSSILSGAVLIVSALRTLGQTSSPLPALMIVFGAAAVAAGILEVRRGKRIGRRIRWIDLLAAALLALEGADLVAHGRRPGYLYLLAAFMTAMMGLFAYRLSATRVLRISADDFTVRLNWLRKFTVRWDEVQSASLGRDAIVIRTRERVRRLSRANIGNWSEVSSVMHERLAARHVLDADSRLPDSQTF